MQKAYDINEVLLDDEMCEVIVEYNSESCNPIEQERIGKILKMGNLKYHLPMINSCVLEIPRRHIVELRGVEGIKSVHQNAHITAQMKRARKVVNAQYAYDCGLYGQGVTIAILDTGICPLDDFTKPVNRIIAFKDFVNMQNDPYDDNGHGTHVPCLLSYRFKERDVYFKQDTLLPCSHLIMMSTNQTAERTDRP